MVWHTLALVQYTLSVQQVRCEILSSLDASPHADSKGRTS
jgi:hypothetical protein